MRYVIAIVIVLVLLATVFRIRRAQRILEVGRDMIVLYFFALLFLTVLWTIRQEF